jgi:hypothetical protein
MAVRICRMKPRLFNKMASRAALAELKNDEREPLSDRDIAKLLGPVPVKIYRYPDLAAAKHIEECLDALGRCVILYLINGPNSGHWQCLWRSEPKTINFFDSYGARPDEAFTWTTDAQERRVGQTRRELTRLLDDAVRRGYRVTYSPTQFQKDGPDYATCGRHVVARLLFKDISAKDYKGMVSQFGDADSYVTGLTEELERILGQE